MSSFVKTTAEAGTSIKKEFQLYADPQQTMLITKYKSNKTGLTVMHVDIDSPLVNGYLTLATEAFEDSGGFHCLEHLVFLGSEQYPYKGVLDSLANRAIAQGTNAWTDVDHTCYTITTAGSQGFLDLLPIYVDHILYPTLTETGCYTEVHHINGKGEDAGVVYSEMQGCQNTGDDRLHLRMKRIMYPENCGYRSETGGLMECLRELSVEKIRSYHQSYYRPDNLCLIITGKVDESELLKALDPIEANITSKGPLPEMDRPWFKTGVFPDLSGDIEETVLFPDEDESMGTVLLAWNGPRCHEYLNLKALEVLNVYLTDSPVSVLQKEFVEIEDPLCTDVDFHVTDHLKTTLMFTASSVPIEEMEELPEHFFGTLRSLIENQDIDMERMATVIDKELQKLLDNAETDAHDTTAGICIYDFLYGADGGKDLVKSVKDHEYLAKLEEYTASDWLNVIQKYYLNRPHVTLLGKPSAEFAEQLAEEEQSRVEKQCEDLGEQKLEELQKKLEDAMATNDKPLPSGILESFKIPPVSSINFINVISARNNAADDVSNAVQTHVNKDVGADVPLFIQYDHIRSRFVKIAAHIATSSIPARLLPYTRLFLKALFSLPVERNGSLISYEDVVKGLGEDTLEYDASLGTSSGFRELAVFTLKAKASKYEKAVQWLQDILWNTQFTAERLKVVANQILNDIPQAKRDGHGMANASLRALQYDATKSASAARNVLFQSTFLQDIVQKLETDPTTVLADLNEFRQTLCNPNNIRVHVTGDILNLETPRSAFKNFTHGKVDSLAPVPLSRNTLSAAGLQPGQIAYVVNLPSIENSFSLHSAKCPHRFDDPDIAPLLVMIELLDTMEGYFWKLIRGQGLAYSCFLDANAEAGLLTFTIYQSPDAFKAFEQAKIVIDQLISKEMEIEQTAVDGAKSAVIYSMVARENTMNRAALQSFVNQVLRQVPASYNRDLLSSIQETTVGDLHRVLEKYFANMFKPETSNVMVVSSPTKTADIQKGFEDHGFTMKTITLNDLSLDNLIARN
ncbi:Metalloenzyme, LuxS/M16 peptidase-like protein [Absidia repens]|uniref:Presequence protease, mitochondrial n=1 Tax=Absidia repens TaxID=90262 RepID=A0A1X2IPN6_9FUNG|nr:Metalloenzyme, LuxS/M16 peptidase-like protein [Absidia repens]